MKKGRPAWTLSALCRPSDFAVVEASLLGETTTLGVRRIQLERTELVREVKWVKTEYGAIPIKISGGEQDGLHRIKPEFDACRKCAQQANVRVSVVIESARRSALEGQWLEHEPIELG